MKLRLGHLTLLLLVNLIGASALSAAQVTSVAVTFSESAPKDRFTITNVGNCSLSGLQLRLNLASSKGRLIFDPTSRGAGVEVFQPLEVTAGQSSIASISDVQDGSQALTLKLRSLSPGAKVSFTVDLDDTLPQGQSQLGQTRVSGAEIAGAQIYGDSNDGTELVASFGMDAEARLDRVPCV